MKYLYSLLLALILSTSSYAACFPDHSGTFLKFMNQLVTEHEYSGNRSTIELPRGRPGTITGQSGSYYFTRSGDTYTIRAEFCSEGEDGQCEASEEKWLFSKGCLYRKGVLTHIRTSTLSDLRFDFVRGGSVYTARYNLLSDGRLYITIALTSPEGSLIQAFAGR